MIKSQQYQNPSLAFRSPTSPPPSSSFNLSSLVSPTQSLQHRPLSSPFAPFHQNSRSFPTSLTSSTSSQTSNSIQPASSANSASQSVSSSPPGHSSSSSSSPPSTLQSSISHHQSSSNINLIDTNLSTNNISSIMSQNLPSAFFQSFPLNHQSSAQYPQQHPFASNPLNSPPMSLTTNNVPSSFPQQQQQQQQQPLPPPPSIQSSSSSPSTLQNSYGFYQNSITSPSSEDTNPITNHPYLRVLNLPRDIQDREFALMFTFANNFVRSNLQRSPPADDGLPSSVVGIAYFETLGAATSALTTLLQIAHFLFSPKDCYFQSSSISPSSFAIKVELVNNDPFSNQPSFNPQSQQQNGQTSQPSSQQSKNVSRFVFSSPNSASGSGMNAPMDIHSTFSDLYEASDNNSIPPHSHTPGHVGIFSPPSPRGINSMHQQSQNSQQQDDFVPRMTGKSLLLESQGLEDEEYNDIVKGVGWYSQTGNSNNSHNSTTAFPRGINNAPNLISSPLGYNMNNHQSLPNIPNILQPLSSQSDQQSQAQDTQKAPQAASPKQNNVQTSAQQTPKSSKNQTTNNQVPLTQQQSLGSQNKAINTLAKGSKVPEKSSSNANSTSNSSSSNGTHSGYKNTGRSGNVQSTNSSGSNGQWMSNDSNIKKNRQSMTRPFQNLSLNSSSNAVNTNGSASSNENSTNSAATNNTTASGSNANRTSPIDGSKIVIPYSPTNSSNAIHIMQNGGRVLPPANPADQNPPCNTLYVGNLPLDTNEDELKKLFSKCRGYKRLCFRTKANGPMCFVEFEDVNYATRALEELYGYGLSNSVKGGIRLSFSKNPLGVRSQPNSNNSNGGGSSSSNNNNSSTQGGAAGNQGSSGSNFGSGNSNNVHNGNSFNSSLRVSANKR